MRLREWGMAECLAAMAPEFDGDRRRSRRASVPAAIAQKGSASSKSNRSSCGESLSCSAASNGCICVP